MMSLRTTLQTLLTLAVGLPIAYLMLKFVAGLLKAMEDSSGGSVISGIATACAAIWPISLVGLLVVLAIQVTLNEKNKPDDE